MSLQNRSRSSRSQQSRARPGRGSDSPSSPGPEWLYPDLLWDTPLPPTASSGRGPLVTLNLFVSVRLNCNRGPKTHRSTRSGYLLSTCYTPSFVPGAEGAAENEADEAPPTGETEEPVC